MERLRRFKLNAGWSGILKTVLIAVLSIVSGFAVEEPYILPVVLAGLILPLLLSKSFGNNPGVWSDRLKYFGYGLFGIAAIGPQFRDHIRRSFA